MKPLAQSRTAASRRRSLKTRHDIFQAVSDISVEDDPRRLSARGISARSGYSVGAIYHHFPSVEHLLVAMFERRRASLLELLAAFLRDAPADLPVRSLVEGLIDPVFDAWRRPPRKVLAHVLRMHIKHCADLIDVEEPLEPMRVPLLDALRRNRSAGLRQLTPLEVDGALRSIQAAIRTPFAAGDPGAGSPQHRATVVDCCMRILAVPCASASILKWGRNVPS